MKYIVMFLLLTTTAYADINLDIIKQIESGGRADAYNKRSGAIGLYQITDICRRDYNIMTGSNVLEFDLYDPFVNERIARWYIYKRIPQLLRHYGHDVTDENVIIAYNAGISYVGNEIPSETTNYINKYKRMDKR